MTLFYCLLFLVGAVLGSFSSVVIHRLRSWEKGIFMGRSKCPHCETQLQARDLFPIFSYLHSWWKCRYCHKKISIYYPALELALWIFFVAIWYFVSDISLVIWWSITELLLLDFWLFVGFFAFIYTVYDILYLEIPESILMILIVGILAFLGIHTIFPQIYDIQTLPTSIWWWSFQNIFSILFVYLSIFLLYIIMLFWLEEKYDVLIFSSIIWGLIWIKYMFWLTLSDFPMYSALIWTLCIFWFFFFQILVSKGKWMWAWDLRIAIVLGLLLGYGFWHAGVMLTYIFGSIIGIGILIYQKYIKQNKNFTGEIPFWPFLTMWLFATIFFSEQIESILKNYFLL